MSIAGYGEVLYENGRRVPLLAGHGGADSSTVFGSDDRSIVREAAACRATAAGPLAPPTTATSFLHVTLPAGHVRDIEPCALGPDAIARFRKGVLLKLARGSVVLPARPRYRFAGSMTAAGGHLFELWTRHSNEFRVARIGIGWRDHGADLVWRACAREEEEPPRPWVVEALDPDGVTRLNSHEAERTLRWVSELARDLAWVVVEGRVGRLA